MKVVINNCCGAFIAKAAKNFAERWQGHGYEKGEAQKFWIDLLNNVFGVQNYVEYIKFEEQVQKRGGKKVNTNFIDGYIPETHVLIEHKSSNVNLREPDTQTGMTAYEQALKYKANLPYRQTPRWIVTCNFKEFLVYDMEKPLEEPVEISLKELDKYYYVLRFLVDKKDDKARKEEEVSLAAGELVKKLYNALIKEYINPNEKSLCSLNILCVRIVFCLYAEDVGLFATRTAFEDYIKTFSVDNLRKGLIDLFKALNTKDEERDKYDVKLRPFPYVNGGLFADDDVEIPNFTQEIVDVIVDHCAPFDWHDISPTIFGALFESTLNPETRRKGGMHYTSIENIHKVIDPLFLDDLNNEFRTIVAKPNKAKLHEFQKKLGSLTFLDPACGCGNFLTETYLCLRRLENQIISILNNGEKVLGLDDFICVKINQFHGIEINDFAVAVAKTALWIAESQMIAETENILNQNIDFLPLKTKATIIEGNALRMDWETLMPIDKTAMPNFGLFAGFSDETADARYHYDYIIGNPPFVGAMKSKGRQREDIELSFPECDKVGQIDYVCGWYVKAAKFVKNTNTLCAFVSTNSICQGQQVELLWKPMFEKFNMKIDFCYHTFPWDSESNQKAHVHCVIVGFSDANVKTEKMIFDSGSIPQKASQINGYLQNAPSIFIGKSSKQISGMPVMHMGVMARDGGHLILSEEEYLEYIKKEPQGQQFIRPYMMGKEFICNIKRYCFWLVGVSPKQIRQCPMLLKRIEKVQQSRLASTAKETRDLAESPHLFAQLAQPKNDFIAFPSVSGENRRYIPIGFLSPNVIVGNKIYVVENVGLYHFGVLTSSVHNAWMRAVCGRLETRYNYSNTIVYNNFVWPENKDAYPIVEKTAQKILEARALYPDCSLADLYDKRFLPDELRKAHEANDAAVLAAYGWPKDLSEEEIVARLFKLYEQLTTNQPATNR